MQWLHDVLTSQEGREFLGALCIFGLMACVIQLFKLPRG